MQPRIRTQVMLVSVLPLLFLIALLVLALIIQQVSLQGAVLEGRTQAILAQLDRIETILADAGRSAVNYGTTRDERKLADLQKMHRQMPPAIQKLRESVALQPGMSNRAGRIAPLMQRGQQVLDAYVNDFRVRRPDLARELANAPSTRALSTQITSAETDFRNAERALEIGRLGLLRAIVTRYEFTIIICCGLGIVLTLTIAGWFGLGMVERLKKLAENAERLARGEPARPLEGSDEFADLDKVYQAMTLRIAREQYIASTLQRALLPQTLPKIDGVRIDSCYTPAADDSEVGGDWYDVFMLSERALCISVGDVAGHGLRAATLMASARLAVRTAARIDPQPQSIVRNLNRVLCADEPDTVVTAFVAVLDLATGILSYSVAGHPPPLCISPDGETSYLQGRGFMLGADARAAFDQHEVQLREGWALVVYTDGVVEAGRDYFKGQARLAEAARAEYFEPSDNIAEAIQHRVLANSQPHDDAALLFIGVTKLGSAAPAPAGRVWTLDAREESSSRRVKRALLWHLGEIVEAHSDLSAVELILGELIGNVARHTPGPAQVALDYDEGQAILCVSDAGAPFEPAPNAGADLLAESGRGLFLVRMMSRELRVEHNGTGNRISAVLPVSLAPA